jgi:hypothetical protein
MGLVIPEGDPGMFRAFLSSNDLAAASKAMSHVSNTGLDDKLGGERASS